MSGDDQAWLYAGARKSAGQPVGMFRKAPGDPHWTVANRGLPVELGVQAIAVHPDDPAVVFMAGGVYIAMEETLEDSYCAELTAEAQHGLAFGVLATVNGVGDLASSLVVGALWSWAGMSAAFGYSLVLFVAGALLVLLTLPGRKTGQGSAG